MNNDISLSIALLGGGARGAYQVGCIKALFKIFSKSELQILNLFGVSAGSFNAAFLASKNQQNQYGIDELDALWNKISFEDVFDLKSKTLLKNASFLLKDLTAGGLFNHIQPHSLLDSSPLFKTIEKNINFLSIQKNINSGAIRNFFVSTTHVRSRYTCIFYDSHINDGDRFFKNQFITKAHIQPEHILASSSIPLFFEPVRIKDSFYFDGVTKPHFPVQTMIEFGCKKIIVISSKVKNKIINLNKLQLEKSAPLLSDIAGALFDSMFADPIELTGESPDYENVLYLSPISDISSLATNRFERAPPFLKYLLNGIGVDSKNGGLLLSYLFFDRMFTADLIKLGYEETIQKRSEILSFFIK